MIQSIVNTLKLDRPIRYYMLLYVLVLLLTYAGNFFYYKSSGTTEWYGANNYIKSLDKYASLCMELSNDTKKCLKNIENLVKIEALKKEEGYGYNLDNLSKVDASKGKERYSYYGHLVLISGKEILDNRRYANKRNPNINVTKKLSSIDGVSMTVITNTMPNILVSVFKSATLSITDVIEKVNQGESKEKIFQWFWGTAIGRSSPHISFLILVFFVSAFMKRSIIAQIELVNELEMLEYEELEKD